MKIRILIDARIIGGTETHVMNLCKTLIEHGHDCCIIFIRHYSNNPLYAQCDAKGLPYVAPKRYQELIALLWKEKPDIIHTHGYKANILGRLLIPMRKSLPVATYHAGEPPIGRLIVYQFIDKWSSFLSYNIAVNAQIAAQLPSNVVIIPNFVELPKTANTIKKQGPYNVYFIGRFSPEKDPIAFCKLAAMPSTEFSWHAVGTGPLLNKAKLLANDKLDFQGQMADMSTIWPKVDLLCITSTHEGLPLVLLEAMSYGIPVVSFDVGSVKSVIQPTGYVIKPGDLIGMHNAIAQHFTKPLTLRKELAKTARAQIENQFSSNKIVSEIERLYSKICGC